MITPDRPIHLKTTASLFAVNTTIGHRGLAYAPGTPRCFSPSSGPSLAKFRDKRFLAAEFVRRKSPRLTECFFLAASLFSVSRDLDGGLRSFERSAPPMMMIHNTSRMRIGKTHLLLNCVPEPVPKAGRPRRPELYFSRSDCGTRANGMSLGFFPSLLFFLAVGDICSSLPLTKLQPSLLSLFRQRAETHEKRSAFSKGQASVSLLSKRRLVLFCASMLIEFHRARAAREEKRSGPRRPAGAPS